MQKHEGDQNVTPDEQVLLRDSSTEQAIRPAAPLPWAMHRGWDGEWTLIAPGNEFSHVTAHNWPGAKQDAEYIVAACNAYPQLTELLRVMAGPAFSREELREEARLMLAKGIR